MISRPMLIHVRSSGFESIVCIIFLQTQRTQNRLSKDCEAASEKAITCTITLKTKEFASINLPLQGAKIDMTLRLKQCRSLPAETPSKSSKVIKTKCRDQTEVCMHTHLQLIYPFQINLRLFFYPLYLLINS